ncbi:MAG: hypothetical protein JRJ77_07405 [Deltaproteobacteria bacterium]|nr:hypothetical protein [Deltaproteobacteria bacterium]
MKSQLHERLRRRILAECKITTLSPLHVGVGRDFSGVSAVDMPILKDASGRAVIPGSSLRGAFRAHTTRLLNSLEKKTLKDEFYSERVVTDENVIKDFLNADSKHKLELFQNFGTIGKLFGEPGFASPLRFTDATTNKTKTLIERTHVEIDLGTDRAAEGGLFDVEAVREDSALDFKMIYDELDDETMKDANEIFYRVLLEPLANGLELYLGGMKSRGYGLCSIKLMKTVVYTPLDLALGRNPEPIKDLSQLTGLKE